MTAEPLVPTASQYEAYVGRLRDDLPSDAFEAAWAAGGRLPLTEAVALALAA